MHFSLKNMLFSFVAGLILFSILMVIVCMGYFNSEIKVALDREEFAQDSQEELTLCSATIFKCCDRNSGKLKFAVLATYDNTKELMLISRISGDFLIHYKDSMSYVSSIYSDESETALIELVKAISGINAEKVIELESTASYADVDKEILNLIENNDELTSCVLGANQSDFLADVKDFPVATEIIRTENTHENIVVINIDKTVENFKNTFGIK